jgi:UDP:flavonoid glycosyltransferase YjiC (YdhE family)
VEKLSARSPRAAVNGAVTRDSYRGRAQEIAKQLAAADGTLPVITAPDQLPA